MKRCCKCHILQPLENFGIDKTQKFDKAQKCKSCHKQYYEENKERLLEKKRQHYEENKEIISIKKKRVYSDEQNLLKRKRYYKENKEAILLRAKKKNIATTIKRLEHYIINFTERTIMKNWR